MPRGQRRRKMMVVYLKSGAVLNIPVWNVQADDDVAVTWAPIRGELTELVYLDESSIEAVVVDHFPERTELEAKQPTEQEPQP